MSIRSPVVHIVDDDPSYRASLSRLLRASGYTVRHYASAAQFLDDGPDGPGCVLIDLRMPGVNGLELQDALAESANPLPVIFVSAQADVASTVRAMKHGAEDFLTKTAPKKDLLAAVAQALKHDVAERRTRARREEQQQRLATLTPREREVLALVVQGLLNKEIAAELGIHERTVKLHRTAVTSKLGMPSVAQLTRFVQEAGFLP